MAQMVKTTTYDAPEKDILLNPKNAFEIGVLVDNTGVTANAEGKKIIPAGTPVGATTSALLTRNTVLSVTNDSTDGSKSQGVLRHDVDVTNATSSAPANATMVVRGEVDASKCPTIASASATALVHIIFVNGGSY